MLIKNIQILYLGLALSTTTLSCFSIEKEEEAMKLWGESMNLCQEVLMIPDSGKQAIGFGDVISLLDQSLPCLPENLKALAITFKGDNLWRQAIVYHSYAITNTKPCQTDRMDVLGKAWASMRGSRDAYKEWESFPYKDAFLEILFNFSMECCLNARASEDPVQSLELFTKAIETIKSEESSWTTCSRARDDLRKELTLSLHKIAEI